MGYAAFLSRRAVLLRGLAGLVAVGLGAGAWMVYHGISVSIQAEENLHATLFAVRLVEQFVAENGRWPRSWEELETLQVSREAPSPMSGEISVVLIGGQHGYNWPGVSSEIRRRVSIDFGAGPRAIARQDPMSFVAIKPIGPYYEYRYYGFVDSLQATIRKSVKEASRE